MNNQKELYLNKIIIYIISIIPFLIPDILNYKAPFVVSIFRLLQIAFFIIYGVFLLKKDYISTLLNTIIFYLMFLLIITFFKKGNIGYCLKNSLNIIGLCFICLYGIKQDKKIFIKSLVIYLSFLNVLNFMSILIYPNGMYLNNSAMYNNWILGYKNSHILYILPWIIVIILNRINNEKNKLSFGIYLVIFISLIFSIHVDSGTAILSLVSLTLLLIFRNKLEHLSASKLFAIAIILFLLIVIFRVQDIFSFIFVNLLGKSLTFTGRTSIWDFALNRIKNSAIFGYGEHSFYYNIYIQSTHNQYLGVAYESGIVGLIIYYILLHKFVKHVDLMKNKKLNMIKYFSFVYMLMMLMEQYNMRYYAFIFIIIYHFCDSFIEGEKNESKK